MVRMNIAWWLPGAALLLFGLLIAIFPKLLALLVASAFVCAGASLLAAGYSSRRFRAQMQHYRGEEYRWFI